MALRQTQQPSGKPKTRDWKEVSKGEGITRMICFKSTKSMQTVAKFWETVETTPFHTRELALATKEINGVLEQAGRVASRPKGVLSFIVIENRLLLLWAEDVSRSPRGGLGSNAKLSRIAKALKLRVPTRARLQNTDDKPTTYRWEKGSDNKVRCIPDEHSVTCIVTDLWQTVAPTAFRPRELMQVTAILQRILERVARSNSDLGRKLSIITYDYRPMLVWTACGSIGPDDELEIVRKELRLKVEE